NSQNNPKMGLVSNPDTRHFLTRDIFTHITYESGMEDINNRKFSNHSRDTVQLKQKFASGDGNREISIEKINVLESDAENGKIHLQSDVLVSNMGDTFHLHPEFISSDKVSYVEAIDDRAGIVVNLDKVISDPAHPERMYFVLSSATRRPIMDYIILKALEF